MRGAFGKPQGTVARVDIGQIIVSVRTKDTHKASAIEAFRRAKFKFPGRQKVGNGGHCCYVRPSKCSCSFQNRYRGVCIPSQHKIFMVVD